MSSEMQYWYYTRPDIEGLYRVDDTGFVTRRKKSGSKWLDTFIHESSLAVVFKPCDADGKIIDKSVYDALVREPKGL